MNWIYDNKNNLWVFKKGGVLKCQDGSIVLDSKQRAPATPVYNPLYPQYKRLPPPLDSKHRFKTKNFNEFVTVMYPIFKKALQENNIDYTDLKMLNLLKQAANESAYGTKPRGSQGYNLGGIKWVDDPKSNTYNFKHTKFEDGEEYVDFDNLYDYANYKVKLLNDSYNAFKATDVKDFINRLHGNNPNKLRYSGSPDKYMYDLTHMFSLENAYNAYKQQQPKEPNLWPG